MILNLLLNAFLTFSIVLPIKIKMFLSAKVLQNFLLGKKNKPFKKILKSIIPKMDPSGRPATISDHEI